MEIYATKGSATAAIALILWFPLVVALFAVLPPRRVVIFSFIFAWLFLPVADYVVTGLPDISKMSVTAFAILTGTFFFNPQSIMRFRPSLLDLPITVFCTVPIATSLVNGLGWYDGFTMALNQMVVWGLPYFLGRVYANNSEAMKEMAMGLFVGGLIYVPLVLYEIRMSPQLHNIVYGYFPHSFGQTVRLGGWRANVFMSHGLMVSTWLTAATLAGVWLRLSGTMRTIRGVPVEVFLLALFVTSIVNKSVGAIILLFLGLAVLLAVHYSRSLLPLTALACSCILYVALRSSGIWDGEGLATVLRPVVPDQRVDSLVFRLDNEEVLGEHARAQPLLGWGGWGRNMVYDERGRRTTITDSFWIVQFTTNGFVGLTAFMSMLLLPILLLPRRIPRGMRGHPEIAPTLTVALVLNIWVVDCLANAMFNPFFLMMAGGLAGLTPLQTRVRQRTKLLEEFVERPPVLFYR